MLSLDIFIAIAVLGALAGLICAKRRAPLDSPWFYLALLAGMAHLGIVVIEGKFNIRQQRIELKDLARQESQERINRGEAIDPYGRKPSVIASPKVHSPTDTSATPANSAGQDDLNYEEFLTQGNAKTLSFLKWLMALAAIAGVAGYWWQGWQLTQNLAQGQPIAENSAAPPY